MATMGFLQQTSPSTITQHSSVLVPETFTHAIAFGQTGSGKTTGFIYPNLEKRIFAGHGILLYDYKGQEHTSVKHFAKNAGRLDDVIEIGKPWGEQINLIGNMGEEELDHFFNAVLNHSQENMYWQNSAKSLGQSVLKVLFSVERFVKVYLGLCEVDNRLVEHMETSGFNYPISYSIESLVKVCNSGESLKAFINGFDDLERRVKKFVYTYTAQSLASRQAPQDPESHFSDLFAAYTHVSSTLKLVKDSLNLYSSSEDGRTMEIILSSLVGPLLSLSQNPLFNRGDFNITKALNEGKIIVVNTHGLSNEALEGLNTNLLNELSVRTRLRHRHPVTLFIDEAQRILSSTTELPVDVLREGKVDVILATQNRELLVEKIGVVKYKALMGNMTKHLYFQNTREMSLELETPFDRLETFSCYTNTDEMTNITITTPIFISQEEKNAVEYTYQETKNVLKEFAVKYFSYHAILEYSPRLFRQNKVILIDLDRGEEKVIKVESLHDHQAHHHAVNKFLQEVITHVGGRVAQKYAHLYDQGSILRRVG